MPALARGSIDADAEKVVRRLARQGHKAYLVGGCVRDLLLDRTPKDFDVATSATPSEIKQLFRNCRIIGRRFRLAHIFFGSKIIETSTFRANPREDADGDSELLIRRDNVFGSATEDARRRDFTINGLFYDVETEEVLDYVGGLDDLDQRLIRTIGQPDIRFREDPVRMLRAIKFAARLGFDIEAKTFDALVKNRTEISKCAAPRVLEEVYRLLRGGAAKRSMELLVDTGVAAVLSPQLAGMVCEPEPAGGDDDVVDEEEALWVATWTEEEAPTAATLDPELVGGDGEALARHRDELWSVLDKLDARVADGQQLSNSLLLAAITNPFLAAELVEPGVRPGEANSTVMALVQPLFEELRVARRDAERARQILLAQRRLAPARRRRSRPMTLVRRDYFEDALEVYQITAAAQGRSADDIEAWLALKEQGGDGKGENGTRRKKRRRRRGGRRRRRTPADTGAQVDNEQGAAAN